MKVKVIGLAIAANAAFHGALTRKLLRRTLVERLIEKGGRFVADRGDILIYTDVEEVALKAERQGATSYFDPSPRYAGNQQLQRVKDFVQDNIEKSDTLLWLSPYAPLVSINTLKRAQERLNSTDVDIVFGAMEDFKRDSTDTPFTRVDLGESLKFFCGTSCEYIIR
jgi:CMP-N-acetylneuraminic acid synthetase